MPHYTQNECYCYHDEECDVCREPIEFDLKDILLVTIALPLCAVIAPPWMLYEWAKRRITE
jgi:hypothetical protein